MDVAFADFVNQIPSNITIPDEEIAFCSYQLTPREFKAGQLLVRPGDTEHIFAFVNRGLFKRYFITAEGEAIILSFDEEHRLISDFPGLVAQSPAQLFVEAIEPSVCLVSTPDLLSRLRGRHPVWRSAWTYVMEKRYVDENQRVIDLLSLTAEGRYARFKEKFSHLESRIPKKDIAAYLGITATSYSRLFSKDCRNRN